MEGVKGSPPFAVHQAGICRPLAHESAHIFLHVSQIALDEMEEMVVIVILVVVIVVIVVVVVADVVVDDGGVARDRK